MSEPLPEEQRASRLSRLLRSRSTSNMFDTINSSLASPRTNSPSSFQVSSQHHQNHTTTDDSGRWSIKSLKREWKSRNHASSLSHFPGGKASDKTNSELHNPIASLPSRNGRNPRYRSQSSSGILLGGQGPSHQEWPERTSSRKGWVHPLRTSVSSKTLSRIICSEDTRPENQSPVRKDVSRSRSSTRVATEPARGGYDYQSTVQVKQSASDSGFNDRNRASSRKVPTQSRPSNPHQRPTLSRGASKNSLTISIENHGQRAGQLNLGYPGTSTSSQAVERGVLSQQTLAPPRDPLLPDSPGFPKMLAAMTFPSPPSTTSRPSSSDKNIGPTVSYQETAADPPIVRPRTSSKRACAYSSLPAASLDELLMQSSRPLAELGDGARLASEQEKCPMTDVEDNSLATSTGAENTSSTTDDVKYRPVSCASSSPAGTAYGPATPATSDKTSSQRQSLISDITTTSSSRQGSPTTIGSGTCTVDVKEGKSYPAGATHRFCSSLPTMSPTVGQSCDKRDLSSINLTLKGCYQISGSKTITNIQTPVFPNRDVDGRKSIVERRMARRAKVQAYKRRDLDAAKLALRTASLGSMTLTCKDSPVLGWFAHDATQPRRLSLRERSNAHTGHTAPARNTAHEGPSITRQDPASSGVGPMASRNALDVPETSSATLPGNDWTLSPIMTIEIVPEYASVPNSQEATRRITLSPIMIVADLRSRPGSPALSISSIHSPVTPHTSSRPALKHRLKIIPQTRPRPVSIMMQRNPTTGDIERTISSASKANRHSFTSMPSLPPSPSSPSIRRRSHPPGVFSSAQVRTGWDRDIALEEQILDTSDEGESNHSRGRVASIRERLQREKLAREEEISELVEKTINAIKPGDSNRGGTEKSHEHIEQQIEGRIQRLEEDGDAWLRVVKGLLENMSKTLHDIREENNIGGLTMNEFTVNLDAEAKRISSYNPPTPGVPSLTTAAFNKKSEGIQNID
ncbi:hypothetical protein F5Y02DRAFT_40149 [Annulohypoxylon stygium]|nr:hypothetical protein F5Y02DRAFT_40149 [Annulohypoxylon stygium]